MVGLRDREQDMASFVDLPRVHRSDLQNKPLPDEDLRKHQWRLSISELEKPLFPSGHMGPVPTSLHWKPSLQGTGNRKFPLVCFGFLCLHYWKYKLFWHLKPFARIHRMAILINNSKNNYASVMACRRKKHCVWRAQVRGRTGQLDNEPFSEAGTQSAQEVGARWGQRAPGLPCTITMRCILGSI